MVVNTFAARRKSPENVVAAASGAGLLLRKLKQKTLKSSASLNDLEPNSAVKDCAGEIGQLIKYLTQNHEGGPEFNLQNSHKTSSLDEARETELGSLGFTAQVHLALSMGCSPMRDPI